MSVENFHIGDDQGGFWYNTLKMIKKFFDHKIWAILSTCIVVLILVVLAMGMGGLHFRPGRPLAKGGTSTIEVSVEKITEGIASIPLWKVVAFWSLFLLLVIIVVSMFPPELRKKILKAFLRFALFVLAMIYIVMNLHTVIPALNLAKIGASESNIPASVETAPAVFTPPQVPSEILYLISLGVVLTLAIIAFRMGRRWLQKRRPQKSTQPLEGLAEVARSSLAEISSGRDWEDVIINCYARMSAVADAQRGLHRRKDLTASEFAARLERAGLPGQAVRRLTNLFEEARYGAVQASRDEVAEAIACLRSVLYACGVNE